jgi:hypothetical protein
MYHQNLNSRDRKEELTSAYGEFKEHPRVKEEEEKESVEDFTKNIRMLQDELKYIKGFSAKQLELFKTSAATLQEISNSQNALNDLMKECVKILKERKTESPNVTKVREPVTVPSVKGEPALKKVGSRPTLRS